MQSSPLFSFLAVVVVLCVFGPLQTKKSFKVDQIFVVVLVADLIDAAAAAVVVPSAVAFAAPADLVADEV